MQNLPVEEIDYERLRNAHGHRDYGKKGDVFTVSSIHMFCRCSSCFDDLQDALSVDPRDFSFPLEELKK